ncbi:hypothetical protein TVAG_015020 [Trichomonas vaginalis G3]|uniref:Uncharacterized protein n=1 Tax=Trichomonas vaginalis (strain ATCC PRA-98 / G3) TaxID=412133 RepID=A2FG71_TRIV3|nr:hypothetical protein TVAGG3_0852270 [Trichomonas vaginalis G3]EAX96110.1 hypothetical protein TVAG_015020 [Trichomonas vaginalis G3]KAI5500082.1 hypothetical protein TVAGG3_0852270 [Trichomonas vaginalis G3]|eukprot:XP_001309040.1 hypothetical protein [Trichomonas vaginalis G3]
MTFCNEISKKLPVWINLSPGLNFNDSMKYVVESYANLTDIFEKPPENNTVNINNDYHLIRNLPINGGTTFHLRASNYSGNLDTYSQISQMYNPKIFKINFTYSLTSKKTTPTLTAYYSKYCVRVFKGKEMNLFDIIFKNRFSNFHKFTQDEFLNITNHSNGMILLTPNSVLSKMEIERLNLANKITCGRFVSGWINRKECDLGSILGAGSYTRSEIVIINRDIDRKFIINTRMALNDFKYYVNDALTNIRGMKYPENSQKRVEVHYRKSSIILSLITSVIFAIFIYKTAKTGEV